VPVLIDGRPVSAGARGVAQLQRSSNKASSRFTRSEMSLSQLLSSYADLKLGAYLRHHWTGSKALNET